jgi:hypothetical protein
MGESPHFVPTGSERRPRLVFLDATISEGG